MKGAGHSLKVNDIFRTWCAVSGSHALILGGGRSFLMVVRIREPVRGSSPVAGVVVVGLAGRLDARLGR